MTGLVGTLSVYNNANIRNDALSFSRADTKSFAYSSYEDQPYSITIDEINSDIPENLLCTFEDSSSGTISSNDISVTIACAFEGSGGIFFCFFVLIAWVQ